MSDFDLHNARPHNPQSTNSYQQPYHNSIIPSPQLPQPDFTPSPLIQPSFTPSPLIQPNFTPSPLVQPPLRQPPTIMNPQPQQPAQIESAIPLGPFQYHTQYPPRPPLQFELLYRLQTLPQHSYQPIYTPLMAYPHQTSDPHYLNPHQTSDPRHFHSHAYEDFALFGDIRGIRGGWKSLREVQPAGNYLSLGSGPGGQGATHLSQPNNEGSAYRPNQITYMPTDNYLDTVYEDEVNSCYAEEDEMKRSEVQDWVQNSATIHLPIRRSPLMSASFPVQNSSQQAPNLEERHSAYPKRTNTRGDITPPLMFRNPNNADNVSSSFCQLSLRNRREGGEMPSHYERGFRGAGVLNEEESYLLHGDQYESTAQHGMRYFKFPRPPNQVSGQEIRNTIEDPPVNRQRVLHNYREKQRNTLINHQPKRRTRVQEHSESTGGVSLFPADPSPFNHPNFPQKYAEYIQNDGPSSTFTPPTYLHRNADNSNGKGLWDAAAIARTALGREKEFKPIAYPIERARDTAASKAARRKMFDWEWEDNNESKERKGCSNDISPRGSRI